jgi:hypothetical protein
VELLHIIAVTTEHLIFGFSPFELFNYFHMEMKFPFEFLVFRPIRVQVVELQHGVFIFTTCRTFPTEKRYCTSSLFIPIWWVHLLPPCLVIAVFSTIFLIRMKLIALEFISTQNTSFHPFTPS